VLNERTFPEPFSPNRPYLTDELGAAICKNHDSPLTVIEGNLGSFNQKSTVERKDVLVNLDISTLGVGNKNTVLHISVVPYFNSDATPPISSFRFTLLSLSLSFTRWEYKE
jgi:hypothetical protein